MTFTKFRANYSKWISFCRQAALAEIEKIMTQQVSSNQPVKSQSLARLLKDDSSNSLVLRFCFVLSLLCRRVLNNACTGASKGNDYDLIVGAGSPTESSRAQTSAQASSSMPASLNLNNSLNANGASSSASHCMHAHMDSDTLGSFQHGYYTLFKGKLFKFNPLLQSDNYN